MKVIIIEDEIIAAQTLQRLIGEIRNDYEIEAVLQTVEESVEWFSAHPAPNLVFMDIHLADGSSFSIFDKVNIDCPIIFTTAYNEYTLEAFEVNGIDYLLKPISKARLAKAIHKFESISYKNDNQQIINKLIESMSEKHSRRKTHYLVPHKDKLIPLAIADIAYFYADMKIAKAVTFEERHYSLDHSLEELMKQLDHEQFFRVNRQYIVSHTAITDLSIWFTGRLAVNLNVPVAEKIVVSKAKSPEFKAWFTRDYTD